MSFQTYDAMTAGRRADQPVDVLAALAGLVQFASRLRTCPPAALAFLRHADGLLRGTEAAPGVARTWAETVLFAEVSVREAQKELARGADEAAAPAPAAAASSFSGFGDRLRSVFGPGDEARQRERLAAATAQLLEHWPRAAPPQPPPFARRASSIEADACGAISGCGVQDTFFAAYRAEPHKVETPPGAEKKRKRRLEEVTTDVQRLDLAEQSTDMDAAAAARLVATAEAEITEGDDLLEGGAMVENAPCGEAAALKFHAACVRLEGVRCAAQHLPAALKRTAASELAYARRAAKTHAPLLENCVVERALYDARDADLRTISRQASAASDRPPQALFRRVDSLAELDARGGNRAQGCLDVLCALDVGVELPFAAVDAADERLRHGAAASSGAPCAVGDKYVVDDELLGRGSYGVVRRCTRKSDGGQFACKTIRLRGGACWDRLHAEISAARKLDHPHICRLHEVFYEKQRVHLIFDLCTGGELWAFLTAGSPHGRRPRPLDEATAQRFAREMLSAVSYMHARGVCHRDLKPQNWLLASAAPGAPLKLVDFGLSRRVPEGLSRSLDDSSSCSSREALEEQLEAVVRAATSRDEQLEAAARAAAPARATPPTPDPRAATPTPARASTPTPAAPATPRTAPASPLAPPPRIVANGPPSPGRKAPRTLSDAVTRRRSGSDLADLDMDDAEDDASARSSATRPRSPATVASNGSRSDRPENGHARRDRGRTGGLSDRVGSFYFVAPEVLRGGHDARCDLWSMGVIVYVLLSGCPPFAGRTDREILSRVARAPLQFPARLWRGASHEARLFVARLLERDVEKRLTAEQALREPWLRVEHARPSARLCSETRHAARAFAKLDGLGKLVAHVVAARAPADRLEDCRRGFAALDRDGDGALGLSEFFLALGGEAGGCGVEEAAALFDAADASGVGRPLSFRAFAALHVGGGTLAPSERSLEDAFDVLDADGASAVSGDDVRAALGVDRCVGADERDAGAALEAHARAARARAAGRGLGGVDVDDGDDADALDFPRFLLACEPLFLGGGEAPGF